MNEGKVLERVPIMPRPVNSPDQLLLLVRLIAAQMIYENTPLEYWMEFELGRRLDYYSIGDVHVFKVQTDLPKRLQLIEISFSNQECNAVLSLKLDTGDVKIVRIKTGECAGWLPYKEKSL